MKNYIKKWHGRSVEDWGSVVSDEFKDFVNDFKKTVNSIKDVSLEKFSSGHYDVSGFVSKDDKYAYFSYSVPRGEQPIDGNTNGVYGILIRTADSSNDYRGGVNHFTNFDKLEENLLALF